MRELIWACCKLRRQYPLLEVIVVDDGSVDETSAVARKCGAKVLAHKVSHGKGAAFLTGIAKARGDYIIQIDADLQFQPQEIPLLIGALRRGHDIVLTTRFKSGHIEPKSVSWLNIIGNWSLSQLVTFLADIRSTDIMAGFKGFTKNALCQLHLVTPHFGYEAEIVIKAGKLGLAVTEIPITYKKRQFGSSSVRVVSDGFKVALTMIIMYLTFPGPPLGKGPVGRKLIRASLILWGLVVIPAFSIIVVQANVSEKFFWHLTVSLLFLAGATTLSRSKLAGLVGSGYLALTPFSQVAFTLSSQIIPFPALPFVGIVICIYFWRIEKLLARLALGTSLLLSAATITHTHVVVLLSEALLVGVVVSTLFLEIVSFRNIRAPLYSRNRLLAASALLGAVAIIFWLKIRTFIYI